MADLQIEPPDESEQESLFGKIVLRSAVVFLCVLAGFVLVLMGYAYAIFLDLSLEGFNTYTLAYFMTSLFIWVLVGLFIPYSFVQEFFESLKGITIGRVIGFFVFIGVFVLLYWYLISYTAEFIVSIFSGE